MKIFHIFHIFNDSFSFNLNDLKNTEWNEIFKRFSNFSTLILFKAFLEIAKAVAIYK